MISQSSHSGLSWTDFIQRVGHLFHDLRMDSLDIANRALFHLGVQPLQSVTENSQRNATITFLYDKVRRAELRRNCWRFSTKRVALRPLTTTTQMVVPALYDVV